MSATALATAGASCGSKHEMRTSGRRRDGDVRDRGERLAVAVDFPSTAHASNSSALTSPARMVSGFSSCVIVLSAPAAVASKASAKMSTAVGIF